MTALIAFFLAASRGLCLAGETAVWDVPVEAAIEHLLMSQDTDGDRKITVDDQGSRRPYRRTPSTGPRG